MIIISKKGKNTVFLPRHSKRNVPDRTDLTLTLMKDYENAHYRFENLNDLDELNDYYKLEFDSTDVADGEYIYLLRGDNCSSIGIIRIGMVSNETKEIIKETKIKEYNG